MVKTIKRVLLSSLSILGVSFLVWLVLLFNPSISYANETHFDHVTVYHNEALDENAKTVIDNAIGIISKSELFHEGIHLELCLNDDKVYPNLNPQYGNPLAFAQFNKIVMKQCELDWTNNLATAKWAVNNYEYRKFNLTRLLAHEFTHNLQSDYNLGYVVMSTKAININWKLEGHAEYVSKEWANDGKLKSKIQIYIDEEPREHIGVPVFDTEDGTKQNLWYYKNALMFQYLTDIKGMSYDQVCEYDVDYDHLFDEMVTWVSE